MLNFVVLSRRHPVQLLLANFQKQKLVCSYIRMRPSLVVQNPLWDFLVIKNPPVKRETWVRSLGWEDPLEKEMAAHFSILEIGRAHV